jgi:hypothetical protein
MKKRLHRAKRLFEVQHQLYRMELSKLQLSQQELWQAQQMERDAFSALSSEQSAAIPPQLAVGMALSARTKVRNRQEALEKQMEQTLDQARKESVAKHRVEAERANAEKAEAKQELETAIDAFLERKRSFTPPGGA